MPEPLWSLFNAEEALDRWIHSSEPDQDLIIVVTEWLLSRLEDPYQGVRREPQFPNLWVGKVPRSLRGGMQVLCAYRIFEQDRRVVMDNIATLRRPF